MVSLRHVASQLPVADWIFRLIAINAISLFFGAIGNLSILLVSDDRAAPLHKYIFRLVLITIIGGFLASFLLIALIIVTATSLRLPSPPGYAYTQAYCYAIMSAVLYFATSSFVIYTAYIMLNTPRSRRELSLFAKGHRVKILTTAFMAYILIGAVIFSKVEGWSYLDGVFWADVTILTVGFGDFKPETHLGRCLLFPYAIFGIFILFLVIYCLTEVVFERGKSMWELRLRDQERIRRVQRREVQGRARTSGSSINTNEKSIEAIAAPALFEESCVSPKQARKRADREARRRDFNAMQEIIHQAARRRIFYSIFLWIFAALFLWLVGAVIFQHCEEAQQQWTYFNALYFTFVALLAIGYGDDTLHSASGKAFFVLWSLIVVPTLTMLISTGSQAVGTPYLLETKGWMRKKMTKKEPPKIQKHLSCRPAPNLSDKVCRLSVK
jgi:potassium channel subfamily K